MTDAELAARYLPIFHFDQKESMPLRAIGWTLARKTMQSPSFPKRKIPVEGRTVLTIEYACYWDYDIQHMYDLEHVWVMIGKDGDLLHAEGSFHGKYLNLWDPGMETLNALMPEENRVHAYSQPGKHAFLPAGNLVRLIPDWLESCTLDAGGPVLTGNPFESIYHSTAEEDALSIRYIREYLTFVPTLNFIRGGEAASLMPWCELSSRIPQWIAEECARLREYYAGGEKT